MSELLTSAQMRAVEAAAIARGEVTGLELMERAGRGVVEAIFAQWPELAGGAAPRPAASPQDIPGQKKAVVLCGPGNNGGDGFVIARLLRARGWAVEVFLYGDAEKLPPDARVNYERWCEMGEVAALTEGAMEGYAEAHPGTRLAIDALFGTGLTRPFSALGRVQDELNYWQAANRSGDFPYVVSVDVPSGLCADSGLYLGMEENPYDFCIMANLTVSFHRRKLGHFLGAGPLACGKTVVADIGLRDESAAEIVQTVMPRSGRLDKATQAHKFAHGYALILSGPSGKTGAARLAARGALRVGAGLVTLGVPHEAVVEVATSVTAIMLTEIDTPEVLVETLKDTRLNALCVGPGFGVDRARAVLPTVLAAGRGTVLDADALTALAQEPALWEALHANCVLTPHAGEFQRLFPDLAARLAEVPTKGPAYSKVDATREAAVRAGCTVLFKGPDTVIAAPDGRVSLNAAVYERAAPWLATAGAGDVLAGIITGLMARGFAPYEAASIGAYLHSEAGRSFGPGLIAEDLPEELPKVFRALAV